MDLKSVVQVGIAERSIGLRECTNICFNLLQRAKQKILVGVEDGNKCPNGYNKGKRAWRIKYAVTKDEMTFLYFLNNNEYIKTWNWMKNGTSLYHSTFRIAAILIDVATHKICVNMSCLNVEFIPKATNMATMQNWSFKSMFCAIQFMNNFTSYQQWKHQYIWGYKIGHEYLIKNWR